MHDQFIGTAVLFESEGIELLLLRAQCASGALHTIDIPVYPVGGTKVREQQWEYRIEGNTLHVRPSVNWVGVFHNGGSWSIPFVRFNAADSQYEYAGDLFRELNGIQKRV